MASTLTDAQLRGLERHLDTYEANDGRLFFVSYHTDKWDDHVAMWQVWEDDEWQDIDSEDVPADVLELAR